MSTQNDAQSLIAARHLRDTARETLRRDLDTLRAELSCRPIASRVRDSAVRQASSAAQTVTDLAVDNRAAIGLTVAVLTGWLFRKRLGAMAQEISGWLVKAMARD
jgi:hypothetical protein